MDKFVLMRLIRAFQRNLKPMVLWLKLPFQELLEKQRASTFKAIYEDQRLFHKVLKCSKVWQVHQPCKPATNGLSQTKGHPELDGHSVTDESQVYVPQVTGFQTKSIMYYLQKHILLQACTFCSVIKV